MDRLSLEVFRFEAGVDYLPYYTKLLFPYTADRTLSDLLHFLYDEIQYCYDKTYLALRINGIAIFENLSITQLVQRFGEEWQIEPLSTYYASKDLLLNENALWAKYQGFFTSLDFITPQEKEELGKYLMLNLITPMSNEYYLGDGFFLYLKWLLPRYPDKLEQIKTWILDKHGGILHFVSIADMVYPRAKALDLEMWDFIRDVVFSYEHKALQHLATLKVHKG